jgi:hypothetical protein
MISALSTVDARFYSIQAKTTSGKIAEFVFFVYLLDYAFTLNSVIFLTFASRKWELAML